MKCIIPCAGEGTRMGQIPKTLLTVGGKPLLSRIVDIWGGRSVGGKPLLGWIANTWGGRVDGFIFVLKRSQTYLWEYLPLNSAVVFQDEPKGLADAILCARPYISGDFMVALGDCIYRGEFVFPYDLKLGMGVWKTGDISELRKSYEVHIQNGIVTKVVEKPREIVTHLCGMGVYFFDERLFGYIERALSVVKPSGGDLTEVIQMMIDGGEVVSPVYFKGDYINITDPNDLWKARVQFEGEEAVK